MTEYTEYKLVPRWEVLIPGEMHILYALREIVGFILREVRDPDVQGTNYNWSIKHRRWHEYDIDTNGEFPLRRVTGGNWAQARKSVTDRYWETDDDR